MNTVYDSSVSSLGEIIIIVIIITYLNMETTLHTPPYTV